MRSPPQKKTKIVRSQHQITMSDTRYTGYIAHPKAKQPNAKQPNAKHPQTKITHRSWHFASVCADLPTVGHY